MLGHDGGAATEPGRRVRSVLRPGARAAGALQALEIIKAQRPDLILMDINLPEMDGYTLTARFKSMPQLDKVPIVALTANVMRGDRERTLEAGCDGYIQKPVDVDLLPDQVSRFLKNAVRG